MLRSASPSDEPEPLEPCNDSTAATCSPRSYCSSSEPRVVSFPAIIARITGVGRALASDTAVITAARTTRYLSPHSDLVALMVLGHQAEMHNLLARASYEVRLALHRNAGLWKLFDETEGSLRPGAVRLIEQQADRVLDYMLFRTEALLKGPITGSADFAVEFSRSGLRDSKDRSLKDLDLESRLLRYPCSYLIYSPAFDALPAPLLEAVYRKLFAILKGAPAFDDHIHLSLPTRRAILEILLDTKPTLPEGWR